MEKKITAIKRIRGTVSVPGDKSISHRALMIAALAEGVSEVKGLSNAADPNSTLKCFQALGIECVQDSGTLKITGKGLRGLRQSRNPLDAGNSGTTMRLLSGILAGQNFDSELTGDASLSKRPMKRILEPLSQMGARIGATERFTAPLKIHGSYPLKPMDYHMPITSAQVKSAIIFAGLNAQGETTVREKVLTRDHTERMLGLNTVRANDSFTTTVNGGMRIEAKQFVVPGDISSAAFLIAAGLIVSDSDLVIQNIGLNPTRTRVLDMFRSM
ncbi:MAG: 3-phosphoshikimate 1-carboxyvinyltransferase, partial [Ignavibacteriales bacterium]|nr:3-phosphoshikimate 1-carboxyvinyltransferase [Ignavibacteriales bacterium]